MIYEYALEPALVARWHDRREYAYFQEKFGVSARRLISAYPKNKWKVLVWKEFRRGPFGSDQNAEKNLQALLADLFENAIKRKSSFECLETWLERAEAEHGQRPFHAILATENPRDREAIIVANALIHDGHMRWVVPELEPVKRRSVDMANAVAPLLRVSREIIFVDPYFDPTKRRFLDTFEAFCQRLNENVHGLRDLSLALHTSIERFFKDKDHADRTKEDEATRYRELRHKCERFIPGVVPEDISIEVVIWKRKEKGEYIHNRYILCDPAGILFGAGLDDEDTGDNERYGEQSEDISLLTASQHSRRRDQYRRGSSAFDPAGDPFRIIGGKK
jgi:hypothetical protein